MLYFVSGVLLIAAMGVTSPQNHIGVEEIALSDKTLAGEETVYARIIKTPDDSLSEIEESVRNAQALNLEPILTLSAEKYPTPRDSVATERWENFVLKVSAIAKQYKISLFEVAPGAADALLPQEASYLLKRTSVAIRSVLPDATIVLGKTRNKEAIFALYEYEISPYIDGVSFSRKEDVEPVKNFLFDAHPKASVWLVEQDADSAEGALRIWLEALHDGASLITFSRLDYPATEIFGRAISLLENFKIIPPKYDRNLVESACPSRRVSFYNAKENFFIVAFYPEREIESECPASVIAGMSQIRDVKTTDAVRDFSEFTRFIIPDFANDRAQIVTSLKPYPLFLEYRPRPVEGLEPLAEEKELFTKAEMPVEEIIARHQIWTRRQNERLSHYSADGEINMHFKIAEFRTSFDITTKNKFFFSRETGMEWEQREIFLNGVRWRSNKIPEVPLIQPEKVVEVPLDLAFDKRYEYRLIGRERVGGIECYKIVFSPASSEFSLYEGVVWIDVNTYAKVKTAVKQTNLEKPIISNTETSYFEPITATDGYTYAVPTRMEGQMIFTTAGRNTILERRMEFSNFSINSDEFFKERRSAYESENQMLRDTQKGFRYLSKEDGERVVKENITRDSLLLVGGMHYDPSVEYPIPLAGINYFSFDFKNTKTQINLFYAGVLGSLNITKPELFGSRLEGSVDAFLLGFPTTDKFYAGGIEQKSQRLKSRYGYIETSLGLPFAHYFKIKGGYTLSYEHFKRADETSSDFVLPENALIHTANAEARFDRKGWGAQMTGEFSRRAKWEAWGLPLSDDYDPAHKTFSRYGFSLAKSFYLPKFQKINFSLDAMGGEDLDRFSQYRATYFGTRILGFGGSGIRWTRGGIVSVGYGFGLGEAIKFEATVDHARTRDPLIDDYLKHTGVGVSANFIAPKNIIVNLDVAYGLHSDIEPAEGKLEARIVIFKLFERRNKK